MENHTKFSIFFLLIISPLILSIHVHGQDNNGDIKELPSKAWGKVKSFFSEVKDTVFKKEQVHTETKVEGGDSTVKKAAKKSFEKGEEVMEGTAKSAAHAAGEAATKAKNKVGEAATKAKDKAGEAATKTKEKAGEATSKTKDKAGEAASKAKEKAGEAASKTKEKAREAATKTKEKVQEQMPSKGHHEGHEPNHHGQGDEPQVEPQTSGKGKKQDEL